MCQVICGCCKKEFRCLVHRENKVEDEREKTLCIAMDCATGVSEMMTDSGYGSKHDFESWQLDPVNPYDKTLFAVFNLTKYSTICDGCLDDAIQKRKIVLRSADTFSEMVPVHYLSQQFKKNQP